MMSLFRCSLVFLLQIIGSGLLLSRPFCHCFQISRTTSDRQRNYMECGKNEARILPFPQIRSSLLSSDSDSIDRSEDETSPSPSLPESHTITLHYENSSCDIQARSDETILTALERNKLSLERLGLPNSSIPSDCRRGNCLTCTGTHASVSSQLASGTAVVYDEDGLSPHMSRTIQEKGYILTCSTRVVGEGLQLNLGENHKIWKDVYQDRLKEEPTQSEKWAAMASTKRRADERNKAQWKQKTKELLTATVSSEENNNDANNDGDSKK